VFSDDSFNLPKLTQKLNFARRMGPICEIYSSSAHSSNQIEFKGISDLPFPTDFPVFGTTHPPTRATSPQARGTRGHENLIIFAPGPAARDTPPPQGPKTNN
jgi:hypothetical protein